MQYDYYAYRQEKLDEANLLKNFEQSVIDLKRARGNARQDAERRMNQVAKQVLQFAEDQEVEPHLPYFWYDIQSSNCKNYIRDAWQKNLIFEKIPEDFGFIPSISDLENLPQFSFMLRVPFKLKKPYLSKDDRSFHLLDNPVRKDKVFQTPMVAPTSWKGALRAALWQLEHKEESEQIIRLFGNEHEQKDHKKLKSGRLYFYPTFFDKISLEVINPHDRKKGTGKNPILIESVPMGAVGDFTILYVPFGEVKESEIAKDLELVAKGVEAMLTVYGFGAKTSSGFGIVDISGKIDFAVQADWPELRQPQFEVKVAEPELPRYLISLEQIHPDFLNPDGTFKSQEQYLQGKSRKKAGQLYEKAKKWWDNEQIRLAEVAASESILKPEPLLKETMTEGYFDRLSELCDRAQQIIENLGTK